MIALAAVLILGAGEAPTQAEVSAIRHQFQELRACISRQAGMRARQELGAKKVADLNDADDAANRAVTDCREEREQLAELPIVPQAFGSIEELDDLVRGLALEDARGALKIRMD